MDGESRRRAAIYLRVSLDRTGEQLAVSRQREDCEELCRARGWEVVAEYVDNSISASDARKQRPGYDALVSAYELGAFDALVCWDLDRLTRQPRQLEDWIERAESRGLLIATANGEADLSTDGGVLFAGIKLQVARSEVRRKGARQTRALQQRADIGRPPLGVRLTGYTTSGDVEPGEAATVRRIFAAFNQGDSLKAIATALSAEQVPTRRGRHDWNPSSVSGILRNPRYAGRAVYRGQETGKRGEWQPLVSDETFARARARLADPRRRTAHGTDRKHLGSGMFLCGTCAEQELTEQVTSWSGSRYRCRNGCFARSMEQVDALVLGVVRERLSRPDVRQLLRAPAPDTHPMREELDRLRARLEQIDNDYDDGVIGGQRHAPASSKVRAQLAPLERRLAQLTGSAELADLVGAPNPVVMFDALTLMPRRAVIDALMTVTLWPAPRGRRTFDPETVEIAWKGQA